MSAPEDLNGARNTEHGSRDVAFAQRAAQRRAKMKTRLYRRSSCESEHEFDRHFWAEAGTQAIWSAAWEMVLEAERAKGCTVPRMQRSVVRIVRRGS